MRWDSVWGLERLLGNWRLDREISAQGRMSGAASFMMLEPGRVLYRESGELHLHGGTTLRSEQRYLYGSIPDGLAVYFHGTEELFQTVVPAALNEDTWLGQAEHRCKADTYASDYLFHRDGRFEIRHRVNGPRKDYVVHTLYTRD